MNISGSVLLALNIVCAPLFGQIFKYATDRRRHVIAVGAINYAFAMLVAVIMAVTQGQWTFTLSVVEAGVFGGVAYAVTFLVWRKAITAAGSGLTISVSRAAVVMPILLSIVFWGESLTLAQVAGILLLLCGFTLMTHKDAVKVSPKHRWGLGIARLLFVCSGFSIATPKVAHEWGCDPVRWLYITLQFASATVVTGVSMMLKPQALSAKDVLAGILLSTVNVLGLFLWTLTLQRLPGVIAYPAFSAGMLVLTTILPLTIWREPITWRGCLGIALTAVAIVLVK